MIELLVVIGIIAILAGLLFPVFVKVMQNARKNSTEGEIAKINMALTGFVRAQKGHYPPDVKLDNNLNLDTEGENMTSFPLVDPANNFTSYYAFDTSRIVANGYKDMFGGIYLYDVIRNAQGHILLSMGPDKQFNGLGASLQADSDDITHIDTKYPEGK